MAAFDSETSFNNGFYSDDTSINSDESNSDDVIYKDGLIDTAPLPSLIHRLTPTPHYLPNKQYAFAFILSSRLFVSPYHLFLQVCETCKLHHQNLTTDPKHTELTASLCQNMARLLSMWTEYFPYDFRDERLIKGMKEINSMLLKSSPHFKRDINVVTHNLYSKLQALHKYEDLLDKINAEVSNRTNNLMPTTDITETCTSPLLLGHQLTHIELERLSMIGPEEFIQDYAVQSPHPLKKLSNIGSYVEWYNRLSYFVATEICMHLKKKNRVRMIEYFVDVAKECINIGNFNSLMAILGGLNNSSVQRLKKTWSKVNKEKFEMLEHLSNPCGNFSSYRSSLKAALWRSEVASDDRERIVVPFFSVLLKDIFMLNENKNIPNRTSNGHVNFGKMWELTKNVNEFMSWKQIECPFERCPPVLNYLLTNPVFSENSLSSASFECEPPESNYEKQQFKQLKEQAGLT